MAEKKKDDKKKKPAPKQHSGGEMSFGMEVLLFVIAIFIIWVLTGKPKTENADKPFIKQTNTSVTQVVR